MFDCHSFTCVFTSLNFSQLASFLLLFAAFVIFFARILFCRFDLLHIWHMCVSPLRLLSFYTFWMRSVRRYKRARIICLSSFRFPSPWLICAFGRQRFYTLFNLFIIYILSSRNENSRSSFDLANAEKLENAWPSVRNAVFCRGNFYAIEYEQCETSVCTLYQLMVGIWAKLIVCRNISSVAPSWRLVLD